MEPIKEGRLSGDDGASARGKVVAYETLASGRFQEDTAWGRPSDVLVLPDGSLLVADDHAGAIYRITYRGEVDGDKVENGRSRQAH